MKRVSLGTMLIHYLSENEAASAGISPGLICVSVGLEDSADLVADFDQALSGSREAAPANTLQSAARK